MASPGHSKHRLDLKPCSVVLRKIALPVSVKHKINKTSFKITETLDSHDTETQGDTSESSDNSSDVPPKKRPRGWTRSNVIRSRRLRMLLSSSDTEHISGYDENSSSDDGVADTGGRVYSHRGRSKYNFRAHAKTDRPVYVESPFSSQESAVRFSSPESENESKQDESVGSSETGDLQDIMDVVHQINVSLDHQEDLSSSTSDSEDVEEGTDISATHFPVASPPRWPTARKSTVNKIPTKQTRSLTQKQASDLSSGKRRQMSEPIQAEDKMEKGSKTSSPLKNTQREIGFKSVESGMKSNDQVVGKDKSSTIQVGGSDESRTKVNIVDDRLLSGSQYTDNGVGKELGSFQNTLTIMRQPSSLETSDSDVEIDVEELSDSCLDPKNTFIAQQEPSNTSSLSSLLNQLPEMYNFKDPKQNGCQSLPTARKTTRKRRRPAVTSAKSSTKKTQTRKGSKTKSSEGARSLQRQVTGINSRLNSGDTLAELSVDHMVDLGSQDHSSQKTVLEEIITSPTFPSNPETVTPKELSPDRKLIYQLTATELIGYEDGVHWRKSTPPDPPCILGDSTPWMKGGKCVPLSAASRWKGRDYMSPQVIAVGSSDQISEDKIVAYKVAKELRGKDSPTKVDLKESCSRKRNLEQSIHRLRQHKATTVSQSEESGDSSLGILPQPQVQQTTESCVNSDSGSNISAPMILPKSHTAKIHRLVRRVKHKLDSKDAVDINKPRKFRNTSASDNYLDALKSDCDNRSPIDKPSQVPKAVKRSAKHRSVIPNSKRIVEIQPAPMTLSFSVDKQLEIMELRSSKKAPKSRTELGNKKPQSVMPSSRAVTDRELDNGIGEYSGTNNCNSNNNQEAVSIVTQSEPLPPSTSAAPSGANKIIPSLNSPSFRRLTSAYFVPPSPEIPFIQSFKSRSERMLMSTPHSQTTQSSVNVCRSVSSLTHSTVQVNNTKTSQLHEPLSHSKSGTTAVSPSARQSSTATPTTDPRKQLDTEKVIAPEISPQSRVYSVKNCDNRLSQSQSQHYYGPMQMFVQESKSESAVSESETDSPRQTPVLWNMKQVYFNVD